jgi:hypothetical protein
VEACVKLENADFNWLLLFVNFRFLFVHSIVAHFIHGGGGRVYTPWTTPPEGPRLALPKVLTSLYPFGAEPFGECTIWHYDKNKVLS